VTVAATLDAPRPSWQTLHAAAATRIATVIDAQASALRAATTPEALTRGTEETERWINALREALDSLEAALVVSEQEWDPTNEPTIEGT